MFDWTFNGVDLKLEGTGGQDCIDYIPWPQRLTETIIISVIAFLQCCLALPMLKLPFRTAYVERMWNGKQVLLLFHTMTFGIELGFKFATNSLIWTLNPCHVVTIVQIFILTAPASPLVTAAFRVHMHMLNGPILALIFPVLNTRLLQFEQVVYYVQHILILVIPFFLIQNKGVFTTEPLNDISWVLLSLGGQTLYHFIILQFVGMTTMVNLDNMLCPAISDPFRGLHYRKWAYLHQTALIAIFGKLTTSLYLWLSRIYPAKEKLTLLIPMGPGYQTSGISDITTSTATAAVAASENHHLLLDSPLLENSRELFRSQSVPPAGWNSVVNGEPHSSTLLGGGANSSNSDKSK